MTSPGTDTLLERLHDFVAAESKRWCNYATGEITFIEVSPAGKLVQEALEALARPAQQPASPVTEQPLADGLQRVIDAFDRQRQRYRERSQTVQSEANKEAWAGLANEKADDLRVLRKLLATHGAPAQRPPFAWLIEREFGSVLHYYAPTEPGEWTRDHLKACRFARKQDAEAIQFRHVARGHLPEGGTRVCEHGWMDRVARELCAGDGEA